MSRVASMRPRVRSTEPVKLSDFGNQSIAPALAKTEPVAKEIALYLPVLLKLEGARFLTEIEERLQLLTTSQPTLYSKYDYLKVKGEERDRLFNLGAEAGYVEGLNLAERNSTTLYRLRGQYKLGYRISKKDGSFTASSFFLELVSTELGYLTWTSCQEKPFSYEQETGFDKESAALPIDSFRLSCNFLTAEGHSLLRNLAWQAPSPSPCLEIPATFFREATTSIVAAFLNFEPKPRQQVVFDSYLVLEAKQDALLVYTQNLFADAGSEGGISSMLEGKNRKLASLEEKTLALTEVLRLPLDLESSFSVPLLSETPFRLSFAARQPGPYAGATFTLPMQLANTDGRQVSNYILDDVESLVVSNLFLFLKTANSVAEPNYPLGENVTWEAERLASNIAFTAPNVIKPLREKGTKSYSGEMSKLYLKDSNLSFAGPNNLHLLNLRLHLTLPSPH